MFILLFNYISEKTNVIHWVNFIFIHTYISILRYGRVCKCSSYYTSAENKELSHVILAINVNGSNTISPELINFCDDIRNGEIKQEGNFTTTTSTILQ